MGHYKALHLCNLWCLLSPPLTQSDVFLTYFRSLAQAGHLQTMHLIIVLNGLAACIKRLAGPRSSSLQIKRLSGFNKCEGPALQCVPLVLVTPYSHQTRWNVTGGLISCACVSRKNALTRVCVCNLLYTAFFFLRCSSKTQFSLFFF